MRQTLHVGNATISVQNDDGVQILLWIDASSNVCMWLRHVMAAAAVPLGAVQEGRQAIQWVARCMWKQMYVV